MASDRDKGLISLESARQIPADLMTVIILSLIMVLTVSLSALQETPLRIILGLPFILFLPGYAFIAALFPERDKSIKNNKESMNVNQRINSIERIGLVLGMSIVVVSLLCFILNFTPWGIQFLPVIYSICIFTIGFAVVAAVSRWKLPPKERYVTPYREWTIIIYRDLFKRENRIEAALSIILALSIVLALGSIGFVVAIPQQGEQFTEFYLLTEDDSGQPVATNYPTEFAQNEPQSIIVGVENNEYETVRYVVVIQLERVVNEGNKTEIIEREELNRFEITLSNNETEHIDHKISPTMIGEELRLTYLLYNGTVPEEPSRENAYRDAHLWITVEETNIQEPIEIQSKEPN